jgi:hypothetical protein
MEYVLVQGREVYAVIRKDHYGDETHWLVCSVNPKSSQRLSYVRAEWCVPLDPSLNVLFKRKEND